MNSCLLALGPVSVGSGRPSMNCLLEATLISTSPYPLYCFPSLRDIPLGFDRTTHSRASDTSREVMGRGRRNAIIIVDKTE